MISLEAPDGSVQLLILEWLNKRWIIISKWYACFLLDLWTLHHTTTVSIYARHGLNRKFHRLFVPAMDLWLLNSQRTKFTLLYREIEKFCVRLWRALTFVDYQSQLYHTRSKGSIIQPMKNSNILHFVSHCEEESHWQHLFIDQIALYVPYLYHL